MKRWLVWLVVCLAGASAAAESPIGGLAMDPAEIVAAHPRAAVAATVVAPRKPRMPAVLAKSEAEKERWYAQLLGAFEQAMDGQRMPRSDVAVAAGLYVTAAYSAYRGGQVSEAAFAATVIQLRDALAVNRTFTEAAMSAKQDMYEGLAIAGTLLATFARTQPGDSSVRAAAKTYLEGLFRGNADALQLTERGLGLAGAAAAAPAPEAAAPPSRGPTSPVQIAALLWSFEWEMNVMTQSMDARESDYLLLADGTCTSTVPANLDRFDPARERAEHPKRWCTWRKRGGTYAVAFGGKEVRLPNLTVMRGGKRGERLAGTWRRQRASSAGTNSTLTNNSFVLHADGRFERGSWGHWSSGSEVTRREGEVVVSGTYDDDGSTATVTGDHAGGRVTSRGNRAPADRSGTYTLDGFTIELRYGNGKVERMLFALSDESGHTFLRLGREVLHR